MMVKPYNILLVTIKIDFKNILIEKFLYHEVKRKNYIYIYIHNCIKIHPRNQILKVIVADKTIAFYSNFIILLNFLQ